MKNLVNGGVCNKLGGLQEKFIFIDNQDFLYLETKQMVFSLRKQRQKIENCSFIQQKMMKFSKN